MFRIKYILFDLYSNEYITDLERTLKDSKSCKYDKVITDKDVDLVWIFDDMFNDEMNEFLEILYNGYYQVEIKTIIVKEHNE